VGITGVSAEKDLLMFEQAFKNIDNVLWKEAGCSTELDYIEQTSWLLFLKYLDDLEAEKVMDAQLAGKSYERIIAKEYQWDQWAAPKTAQGEFDHNNALTGDDLVEFVNDKLFRYLRGFKDRATGPDTLEYKISESLRLKITGTPSFNYVIQTSFDLIEWIDMEPIRLSEQGSGVQVVPSNKASYQFFRLRENE
jgi:type I restriction enzyme M protein